MLDGTGEKHGNKGWGLGMFMQNSIGTLMGDLDEIVDVLTGTFRRRPNGRSAIRAGTRRRGV